LREGTQSGTYNPARLLLSMSHGGSGQITPEWVDGLNRNQWTDWIGMSGRISPESVDGLGRNTQPTFFHQIEEETGQSPLFQPFMHSWPGHSRIHGDASWRNTSFSAADLQNRIKPLLTILFAPECSIDTGSRVLLP
jgi:hypothetical protein